MLFYRLQVLFFKIRIMGTFIAIVGLTFLVGLIIYDIVHISSRKDDDYRDMM